MITYPIRILIAMLLLSTASANSTNLPFIPWPKDLTLNEGQVEISSSTRLLFSDDAAKNVAESLAEDLKKLFKLEIQPKKGTSGKAGDIILQLDAKAGLELEEYHLDISKGILVKASKIDGLYAGTVTLLQALSEKEGKVTAPALVIKDKPSRELRAHMIDMKNQWHSIAELKKFVDLCRWYKVRYLSLHSGEDQWIGALLTQTGTMTAEERQKHRLYSKEEMDELIAYGSKRGVYLFPHNECTPGFNHMRNAMRKDYNPNDQFAGFPDELDGKGSFEDYQGKANPRWLKLMEITIDKAIDQFASAYPDGKLPYYHIGPVLGEGGMSPQLAAQILKMIQKKSPGTQMMFWNGISAKDESLSPFKEKCVIAYYDDEFGQSDMQSYLEEGWPTVNSAWSPLYVVGSNLARPIEWIYRDWNVARQGSDGVPGGYGAITWESIENQKLADAIMGGMLCTWETPLNVHLARVRVRVPAMNEHAWNVRPWPYAKEEYATFETRLLESDRQFTRFLGGSPDVPNAPTHIIASEGTSKGKVKIQWRNGGGNTEGFRVMRSLNKDRSNGNQISPELPVTTELFIDTKVEKNSEYFYWIEAFNATGISPASTIVTGSPGSGESNIHSYESFTYHKDTSKDQLNRGPGWTNSWDFKSDGSSIELSEQNLTYPGLETSGGSLHMRPQGEKKGASITRNITGKMGLDETTMWISYLLRANKVGIGDLFVAPNSKTQCSTGKVWGNDFSIYMKHSKVKMKPGKTYFVVARYDFGDADKVALWINPKLEVEPSIESANLTSTVEVGSGNSIRLQMQGHGDGDYLIDELRLGTDWASIGGLVNQDDTTSPNPNPMTWIGPPSPEKDGSVYMIAADAEDPSGTEYLFECVETKETSGWQKSSEYRVEGLPPGTYSYRVRVRDRSANKNKTDWSFAGKVTVK